MLHTSLLFISGSEIFVVLLAVLLLFGSKKIPELARGLGKGLNEFKKATNEIKKEISDFDPTKEIKDLGTTIERNTNNDKKPL
ncbi:MAG: hypothetical protein RIS47_1286 [Bacteroidota bacterium]|jgi:sec-independent protein translocase protein TatA